MKKLFLFFSVVFGVMFFWGCTYKAEPTKKQLSVKKDDRIEYLYEKYFFSGDYEFLYKTSPIVRESNDKIYFIFKNKKDIYAPILIYKNQWKFIPLKKLTINEYNKLLNAKKPIILDSGNAYLYLSKNKIFYFKFYKEQHKFEYILGREPYYEIKLLVLFDPVKALEVFLDEDILYWGESYSIGYGEEKIAKNLRMFITYKDYLKPFLINRKINNKNEADKFLKIAKILYEIEDSNVDKAIELYKKLKEMTISYIYNPNPGGVDPLKEGTVDGEDIIYYTQANVILKNKILSEYFNKLKKAKNIEEVYNLIKTYEAYDKQDYIINYKTPATKSFKDIEKNKIMNILKKDIQNTLLNKDYKKFMKIVDLIYKISSSDTDFTGLRLSGDEDYTNIGETYLAKLYFPTTCCKKVSSVFDLKYDIKDFNKNYACIKCQKQFKGGMRVCKVCGNIKNGVINKGEVTVYYIKAANTWLFKELWRTKEFKGKFNSFEEIKPLIKKLQQLAIADYNKKYETYKNKQSSSIRIAIKNCSNNKCYIYSYGNYDGLVTWFYENGHYRLSLTTRSGWGIYYPDDKELNTGKCGKIEAKNLDDAISKFVKCYYIR